MAANASIARGRAPSPASSDVFPSSSLVADHVAYLVARLGPERVAFGSDFDGATMPRELGDATLRPITHENWLRVLERTWGA